LHEHDDQIVPVGAAGLMAAKHAKNSKLKVYAGYPHGMCQTHADEINADLLTFLKSY
jgi:non-heme chloroperoxidase